MQTSKYTFNESSIENRKIFEATSAGKYMLEETNIAIFPADRQILQREKIVRQFFLLRG